MDKDYDSGLLLAEERASTEVQTSSAKPHQATVLDDIFISVKTTKNFHKSRLFVVLTTWFQLAKDQVSYRNRVICRTEAEVMARSASGQGRNEILPEGGDFVTEIAIGTS